MKRIALLSSSALAALTWAAPVFAQTQTQGENSDILQHHQQYMGEYGNHMGGGHMWGGEMWAWHGVISMVVVAAIVGLVVWLVVRATSGRGHDRHRDSAVDLLRERYARGEIDHDEFEERRRRLE